MSFYYGFITPPPPPLPLSAPSGILHLGLKRKKMAGFTPTSPNSMSWVRALHRYRKGLNCDDDFFAFISSFIGSNI